MQEASSNKKQPRQTEGCRRKPIRIQKRIWLPIWTSIWAQFTLLRMNRENRSSGWNHTSGTLQKKIKTFENLAFPPHQNRQLSSIFWLSSLSDRAPGFVNFELRLSRFSLYSNRLQTVPVSPQKDRRLFRAFSYSNRWLSVWVSEAPDCSSLEPVLAHSESGVESTIIDYVFDRNLRHQKYVFNSYLSI